MQPVSGNPFVIAGEKANISTLINLKKPWQRIGMLPTSQMCVCTTFGTILRAWRSGSRRTAGDHWQAAWRTGCHDRGYAHLAAHS